MRWLTVGVEPQPADDISRPVGADRDVLGVQQLVRTLPTGAPHGHEVPGHGEALDAVVPPVGHDDPTVRGDGQSAGTIEVAVLTARFPPHLQQRALGTEALHPAVVAVHDHHRPVLPDRDRDRGVGSRPWHARAHPPRPPRTAGTAARRAQRRSGWWSVAWRARPSPPRGTEGAPTHRPARRSASPAGHEIRASAATGERGWPSVGAHPEPTPKWTTAQVPCRRGPRRSGRPLRRRGGGQ